ncbi:MAG TPA: FixH family protein [Spirochaetota bacterium]|nr:FixH family protein [Spirochaetota bacterium]HOD15774.1 FixH family protein [Spirochaetota bacterium]HPG52502.1 FixH family protein [Spirochaetota bacterium]HPN12977.1 FixH family protein [Spirochaetota bacterium]HQL80593.1 FixH family protein [Spirochaetota bacterium]
MSMIQKILIITILSILPATSFSADNGSHQGNNLNYVTLGDRGSRTAIGGGRTFTYDFDRSPAMGMIIVKVQVFDKAGRRVTDLRVFGESGMPSMRGAHDSGEVPFKLSKKGVYLLPVNIVMPGTWEVRLRFMKGHDLVFAGRITFDV